MLWHIFINHALSGRFGFNFVGDKKDLMTFIGCYVSTCTEKCDIRYCEATKPNEKYEFIHYYITKKERYLLILIKVGLTYDRRNYYINRVCVALYRYGII